MVEVRFLSSREAAEADLLKLLQAGGLAITQISEDSSPLMSWATKHFNFTIESFCAQPLELFHVRILDSIYLFSRKTQLAADWDKEDLESAQMLPNTRECLIYSAKLQ